MVALVGRALISDRKHRALTIAVVVSVLLHIGLLLVLPMLRDARQLPFQAREPILARFVEPAKPAPAAAPPALAPEATEPVAMPAPPQPVSHQVKPAAKPVPRPPLAVEPTPGKTDSPAPTRSSAIQAQPALAFSEAPDAGTLAQYRLALISATRRYKGYPPLALEKNWQGKVDVRMTIGADGSISSLAVRSSTGYSLLDQQALDMIERARAVAQIPQALRGMQFAVDIPVEFSVREPGA